MTPEKYKSLRVYRPHILWPTCDKCQQASGAGMKYEAIMLEPAALNPCPREIMHRWCDRCGYQWDEKLNDEKLKGEAI